MWVKICANTNLEDALLAAKLGADALGFVFAESSARRVYPDQIAGIIRELPAGVEKVGVFDRLDLKEIAASVDVAKLTGVQLHGVFDPELVESLQREFEGRVEIIQTLHWAVGAGAEEAGQFERTVEAISSQKLIGRILVDAKTANASGGTGLSFDWASAQPSILAAEKAADVIVAGGLNPENVAEAIAVLKPWGVDVASGVEATKGKKDAAKLTSFIRNAKQARS